MTPDQTESGTSASKNVSVATGHTYWVIPDGYIPRRAGAHWRVMRVSVY